MTQPELTQPTDGLQPAEDLLDQFSLLLADRVAVVTRGPIIDGAPRDLLGDVRRDTERPHASDEAGDIEPFVPADGRGVRGFRQQQQRGLPFGGAGGGRHAHVGHQTTRP